MKKIFILINTILLASLFGFNVINTTSFSFAEAYYNQTDIVSENNLPFEASHVSVKGESGLTEGDLDPQEINMVNVPKNNDLQIVTWAKISNSRWTMASVKSIASDYELNHPGYKVIAAINGDFFDINGTRDFPFATGGIHVSDGENYKTTDNDASSTREPIGFLNDQDKSLLGNVPIKRSEKMEITVYLNDTSETFIVDKVNEEPGDNETSVFYGLWENRSVVPIDVTNSHIINNAIYTLPHSISDFYGKGYISEFGNATLDDGDFAIKTNNLSLNSLLSEGTLVRVQYEFLDDFGGIKYATGAGKPILYDNIFYPDDTAFGNARHPRTMIGIKEDNSILMMVVDGRQSGMTGASQKEMAVIMKNYGAVEAYNLDGGGSSTMLILKDGELKTVNTPSDGRDRSVSNAILVVAKSPDISISVKDKLENTITFESILNDKNGYVFDDYYIMMNDEIKKVENNNVVFNDLKSNTNYSFYVYYKIDEEYISFPIQSTVTTAKKMPYIDYVHFDKKDNQFMIKTFIVDEDNAIERQFLIIDDENYIINDQGEISIYDFRGDLTSILGRITYDLNDNNGRKQIDFNNLFTKFDLKSYMIYTNNINYNNIKNVYN
ncbi:MAG: phosphodiester glycosidase family protein [Bacilli bacterium]